MAIRAPDGANKTNAQIINIWCIYAVDSQEKCCGVKFLAWKSGCVKFLTNSMSELSEAWLRQRQLKSFDCMLRDFSNCIFQGKVRFKCRPLTLSRRSKGKKHFSKILQHFTPSAYLTPRSNFSQIPSRVEKRFKKVLECMHWPSPPKLGKLFWNAAWWAFTWTNRADHK